MIRPVRPLKQGDSQDELADKRTALLNQLRPHLRQGEEAPDLRTNPTWSHIENLTNLAKPSAQELANLRSPPERGQETASEAAKQYHQLQQAYLAWKGAQSRQTQFQQQARQPELSNFARAYYFHDGGFEYQNPESSWAFLLDHQTRLGQPIVTQTAEGEWEITIGLPSTFGNGEAGFAKVSRALMDLAVYTGEPVTFTLPSSRISPSGNQRLAEKITRDALLKMLDCPDGPDDASPIVVHVENNPVFRNNPDLEAGFQRLASMNNRQEINHFMQGHPAGPDYASQRQAILTFANGQRFSTVARAQTDQAQGNSRSEARQPTTTVSLAANPMYESAGGAAGGGGAGANVVEAGVAGSLNRIGESVAAAAAAPDPAPSSSPSPGHAPANAP